MTCISRTQFLENFVFDIDPEHDFHHNGVTAAWAPGHPKIWGDEDAVIRLPKTGKEQWDALYSAVSSDEALLAVGTEGRPRGKIFIFDIETCELRQMLDGCGSIYFRPCVPASEELDGGDGPSVQDYPRYTLICSALTDDYADQRLMLWELDKHGRLLDEAEPLDTSAFATKAIKSIEKELIEQHEWLPSFIFSSTLQTDFEAALKKAEIRQKTKHNTAFEDAQLASFGSEPFSADGKRMIYLQRNNSTQGGMREPSNLPQAVVFDLEAGKELFRLCGHTDSIMWAGFSPNGQHIATVSWDGSLRMYEGSYGELSWATKKSNQQSWAAEFSPDSSHIVWSTGNGQILNIHNVSDGEQLAEFPIKLCDWSRSLSWNADGQSIALAEGTTAYIWRHYDKLGNDSISLKWKIKVKDGDTVGFASIDRVKWLDGDVKLAVTCSDGSTAVWDRESNLKEAFIRPKGTRVGWSGNGFHFLKRKQCYVSVDGDDCVRFWNVSERGIPTSWWDRKAKIKSKGPKRYQPSTGKFVNITKMAVSKEPEVKGSANDPWVAKGSELWTAE